MGEHQGLTRRQMLRTGTLVGATAAWIAPSATVHAMSQSLAEPTSGERNPPEDDDSDEQPETTTPRDEDQPSEPIDDRSEDEPEQEEQEEEEEEEEGTPAEPSVDVPEVEVKGTEIVAETPTPPGAPAVNPPPIIAAQETELPRTGIDADLLTGIGTGLTALGAAALRFTREPDEG